MEFEPSNPQNASTDYTPNGKKKVFTLAPVEDDLTFTILNVRRQVLEDSALDDGAKVLFVYILDKALNRNLNSQPGVVTISQTRLGEVLNKSERTIFTYKRVLVQRGYLWMSRRSTPNTWPIDTYHVTAIHPPVSYEEKTSSEGLWGNGSRRFMIEPPLGARRPGQKSLPLPGSRLPGKARKAKSAKMQGISADTGSQLPPSPEVGFGPRRKSVSGDTGSGLPVATEAGFRGQPKPASGVARSGLPVATEAGFRQREVEVGDLSVSKGEGNGAPPPDGEFAEWSRGLEGMFPSKLRKLENDLKGRVATARSDSARATWKRRLEAVQERLLGGAVPDAPKPVRAIVASPAPKQPTAEEILEGARYLVSVGKEKLLTKAQREALKDAKP